MSTQPIDYAALAEQARQQAAPKVDYAALAEQARQSSAPQPDKRSFFDKALEVISKPADYFTDHTINAIDAAKSGQYAKSANEGIRAGTVLAAPFIPQALAAAPMATVAGIGTGMIGGKVAQAGAKAVGATDDQAELAGNIGGAVSGLGAGKATQALTPVARALKNIVPIEDLIGFVSPRAAHGMKLVGSVADFIRKNPELTKGSGLPELLTKHTDAISATEQTLNDALSKANALPPEGPTATLKDVPDLRVQPSQQAPRNLLAQRKAAFQAAQQKGAQGEFQVNPPDNAVPPSGKVTPNMEIYNEPDIAPKPLPKQSLLDQLREWDGIRKIHAQLEDQIGKGQDEIQQWMEDHNQAAPGGKNTSAAQTAKARFQAARAKVVPGDEPRVPTSDADMEELLMKSVQAAKGKKAMAAKAGD